MADGYWDDMEEEKKKLFCSAFPCLFCLNFWLCSFGEKGKILGKTIFSLLGSSSTFIAIWDAYLSTA